jgi:hypothetical protein
LFSLEKLISVAENLTKSHFAVVATHQKKMSSELAVGGAFYKPTELTYNFIRSLVLDNIVENPILLSAFLTNQINNLSQLEAFAKISYTNKF